MMLEGLGAGREVKSVDETKLVSAIEWLGARALRAKSARPNAELGQASHDAAASPGS
jgi:hypothetical protein